MTHTKRLFTGSTFLKMCLLPVAASLLFMGCASHVPFPVTYPFTTQQKMQAAHHWDVLADDVAGQIVTNLRASEIDENAPVYIRISEPTLFGKTFHDLMISQLVRRQINVCQVRTEEASVLDYTVNVVRHDAKRVRPLPPFTFLTALAAGVSTIRHAAASWAVGGAAAIATDVAMGHFVWKLPHTEVVISTTIVDKNQYVMSASNIYYINDPDAWHYQAMAPPYPALRVKADFGSNYMDMQFCAMKKALMCPGASFIQRMNDILAVCFKAEFLFDFDSANINPGAMDEVNRVAQVLTKFPQSRIRIEGHTDGKGDLNYNQRLSERRAQAIKAALIVQGIDPSRVEAVGFGEGQPVLSNQIEAGQQHNRRVRVVIIPLPVTASLQ